MCLNNLQIFAPRHHQMEQQIIIFFSKTGKKAFKIFSARTEWLFPALKNP